MLMKCGRLLGHDDRGASIYVLDGKVWYMQDENHIYLIGCAFNYLRLVRQGYRTLVRV
jgi:hypothetical protein